jgi:5-methylcytosine-specific restriction endonuclease McrA
MLKHICIYCKKSFEAGNKLGGHIVTCQRKLNDLKTDRARRKRLIQIHGHKCFICQLSIWLSQSITLELDHIDGNNENNLESNLRLLCPNCHAQTPTWKGKNVGKCSNSKRQIIMSKYL